MGADRHATRAAYETERMLNGGGGLASTPILDFDLIYSDLAPGGDIHMKFQHFSTRERLRKANGHADNHVMWSGGNGPRSAFVSRQALARTLFETFALARAARRGASDQVEHMRGLLAEAALARRNVEAWYESSQRFHDAIIHSAGNAQLKSLYDFIKLSMRRYQLLVIGLPRHPGRSQAEHQKIFDALVRGDAQRACALLEAHIQRVADTLTVELAGAERGEEGPRCARPRPRLSPRRAR